MTLSPYTSPNRRHLSPRLHKITSKTPSPRKTQLKRSIDGAFVGIGHHIPLEFDVEVRKGVFMRLEYCVGFGARAGAEFNLRRRYSAEYHNLKLRRLFERAIERDVAPEYRRMLIENEQSRSAYNISLRVSASGESPLAKKGRKTAPAPSTPPPRLPFAVPSRQTDSLFSPRTARSPQYQAMDFDVDSVMDEGEGVEDEETEKEWQGIPSMEMD